MLLGVGGVWDPDDGIKLMACGGHGVQVCTALMRHPDLRRFGSTLTEAAEQWLAGSGAELGVESLSDIVGRSAQRITTWAELLRRTVAQGGDADKIARVDAAWDPEHMEAQIRAFGG